MLTQQDDVANFQAQHSLIGSWFMEYSNDADSCRVEYLFCIDGTGVERISTRDSSDPDKLYVFKWDTAGDRLSVTYAPGVDSRIVMQYCFDNDRCIFEDPERISDSMIIKRFAG